MSKKLAAVIPLFGLFFASKAHAAAFHTNGTATEKPAPVAPATACSNLRLYAADTSTAEGHLQRYRFSGECQINVAPAGKYPVVKTVPVLINAEWSPKMKRASETVTVQHPDLGVELTTWATCARDPFVERDVACSSQGIGANKFSAFLRNEDVPFSRGRTNASEAKHATDRIGADTSKLYAPVQIVKFQQPGLMPVGTVASYLVDVTGGIRLCPMQIDYGDGTVERVRIEDQNQGTHTLNHTWAKPGLYKVKARALPGCTGESEMTVIVKTPYLKTVSQILPATPVGELAGISVVGADGGMCKMQIDWGDGANAVLSERLETGKAKSFTHAYASAGKKTVKVKGLDGCQGEISSQIDVASGLVQSIDPGPTVKVGGTAGFNIRGIGAVCGVHIDYGDGGAQDFPNAGFGGAMKSISLWRIYQKPGTYTVKVNGINGCTGSASRTVEVVQ